MTTAAGATAEADVPARKLPKVDPAWVSLHHDGGRWREWLVRLPETAVLTDLNETVGLWEAVQDSKAALHTFDRVTIVSWAEDWAVEARVVGATKTRVQLSIIKRFDLVPRHNALPQDDKYQIIWAGNGYRLRRKSDQLHVSPIVQTVAEAERALASKYSRAI
jgi:hypothetical protein